ncbi:unnamed protein product [Leuciscus chuanchicus]
MNYQQDKATLWRGPRTIQIREVDITLENISRIFKRLALSCYPAQQGTLGTSNYQGDMRFVERKALLHQCHCQPNLSQHNLICSDLRPGLWLLLSVQDQRLHQPQEAFRGLLQHKPNTPSEHYCKAVRENIKAWSISIGRVEGGVLRADGGTLYVTFLEREANVSTITEKVKHDLGSEEDIVLCDGQGNRLIEGIGTTGLLFWKQNARKIVALCDSAYQDLMRRKRRRTSGIDDQTVRCVEELVLAAEELPAITEALRDLGLYARANRVSTVALTGDQVATVRCDGKPSCGTVLPQPRWMPGLR